MIGQNWDQSKLESSGKFEGEKADAVNMRMRVKLDRSVNVFE